MFSLNAYKQNNVIDLCKKKKKKKLFPLINVLLKRSQKKIQKPVNLGEKTTISSIYKTISSMNQLTLKKYTQKKNVSWLLS